MPVVHAGQLAIVQWFLVRGGSASIMPAGLVDRRWPLGPNALPGCKTWRTTNITLASDGWNVLAFEAATDPYGLLTGFSTFTARWPGLVLFSWSVQLGQAWTSAAVTQLGSSLWNPSAEIARGSWYGVQTPAPIGASYGSAGSVVLPVAVGDSMHVRADCSVPGNAKCVIGGQSQTRLDVQYLSGSPS